MGNSSDEKEHGAGWETRGSYTINVLYVVLFLIFYVVLFWQLSLRWGVQ